jgi:salicylate hydroxylase
MLRIGFSFNKNIPTYKVEDTKKVLTIEEMNAYGFPPSVSDTSLLPSSADTGARYDMYKDIEQALAEHRGQSYTDKFIHGLPIGLELPNGVVIGA